MKSTTPAKQDLGKTTLFRIGKYRLIRYLLLVLIVYWSAYFFFNFFLSGSKKSSIAILFENIMIRENGIYTLIGTKPITEFPIDSPWKDIPQSEDELKRWYKNLIDDLQAQGDTNPPTFNEYKKEKAEIRRLRHLHRKNLWNEWEISGRKIQNRQFKLLARVNRLGHQKTGLFVNIPATEKLLQSHYQSFKERVGFDFDIPEIINELESEDSVFWLRAFNNHYLSGLLFGFGEKEASQFDQSRKNPLNNASILRKSAMSIAGFDAEAEERLLYGEKLRIEDLGIPSFTIFSEQSELVNTYLKQRSQILKQLKGKSLETFLINYLKITPSDSNLKQPKISSHTLSESLSDAND